MHSWTPTWSYRLNSTYRCTNINCVKVPPSLPVLALEGKRAEDTTSNSSPDSSSDSSSESSFFGVPNPSSPPDFGQNNGADDEMPYTPNPGHPVPAEVTTDDDLLEPASKRLCCHCESIEEDFSLLAESHQNLVAELEEAEATIMAAWVNAR